MFFNKKSLPNAVQDKQIDAVKNFVQNGHDVNEQDKFPKNTGLMWAAYHGLDDIAVFLLSQENIDVNKQNSAGMTAFMLAVQWGPHINIAKAIINNKDFDPNLASMHGLTPLAVSSALGCTELVEILLQKEGIKTDTIYSKTNTALSLAKRENHTDIIKLLEDFESRKNYPKPPATPKLPKPRF